MKKLLPLVFILCALVGKAQTYTVDSARLEERFKKTDHILNILREFRIQIYLQPEWQRADTAGAPGVQGGNLPAAANNRFILRRGRFKLAWQHEMVNKHGDTIKVGEAAFQFDASEKGFNALKDFYGRIIDPWTGWFSFQAGITVRPFGFESPASPATYESPEFSRMNQTIMPNECELGETFIIESPRKFKPVYLRFDAAVVNGEGIGNTGTNQSGVSTGAYQSAKDFVGRLFIGKTFDLGGGTKIGLNASGSVYYGNVLQSTNNVFEVVKNAETGLDTFKNVGVASGKGATNFHREYYGAHLQVNFDYKMGANASATTAIRGEFITGQQPGQAGSSTAPIGTGTSLPTTTTTVTDTFVTPGGSKVLVPISTTSNGVDLYVRKFQGYMITFTQGFHFKAGNQMMHADLTFKMDNYDPNTQISGTHITKGAAFSTTDLAYNTYSGGFTFTPVPYFKLMLWYDHVVNESSGISGWSSDYKKDNVFTLRTQFMLDSWWFDKKSTSNSNLISRSY